MKTSNMSEIANTESVKESQNKGRVYTRMHYRRKTIEKLRERAKNGIYPVKLNWVYPKMDSSISQTLVNDICDKAKSDIFNIMIEEYEEKQSADRDLLKRLKKENPRSQKVLKPAKKKTDLITSLQAELADLREKYNQLTSDFKQ